MSDTGGNNSNSNDSMMKGGNSPQNSFGNSQNPESSNNYANRPNDMNSYDSNYGGYNSASRYGGLGSSYGSGYGSGYGSSYGSGFGSSYGSGYGSSYGSGYGSTYGSSYGSGYSSYGPNQYSNTYSKPLQPGQQGQQGQQNVPPPTFRHDVWGFLNGFHAILNVMYAGTGIVHFGKMFMKMSMKIIKAVFGKSAGLVYKLTGFQFLKNIMQKFAGNGKGDWFGEFNVAENPLENVWANGPEPASTNKTFFGKFMLVLRILSLMGGIVAFFLRRKVANNQHPPVQMELLDPEIPQVHLKSDDVGLEGIKSFYDEVKLIEQDHEDDLQDITSLKEVVQEVNGEIRQEKEENSVEMKKEEEEEKNELKNDVVEVQEENNQVAIISSIENQEVVSLVPELPVQVSENQNQGLAPETQVQAQISSTTKEQIVSEDFWKNEEVFKKIESIQKENAQSEAKQETFELPSVLKTLKSTSSTSTKPWLMKKKKNPEPVPAPETSIQTVPEATIQTLPSENPTPEMPVFETQKESSEVVEVPTTIENPIEGTA